MASNRPQGFGLSRELAEKNAAKYSVEDEVSNPHYNHFRSIKFISCHFRSFRVISGHSRSFRVIIFNFQIEIMEWICAVTGAQMPIEQGPCAFQDFLRDGRILCQLVGTIQPGICRKAHDTTRTKLAVSFILPGLT